MTKPQIIIDEGGNPAFAVIRWREYERLITAGGEASLTDEELYDRAKTEAELGRHRLSDGLHPGVYRPAPHAVTSRHRRQRLE